MVTPISPRANEEVLHPEDIQSKSSDEEDPYGPPYEVALDPTTLEWSWGQYYLCVWKLLPLAEKARKVAFKKEMAEEKARYQAACEAREIAWKKEVVELWGRARHRVEEVYSDGYFARKVNSDRRLIAAWR
ncbi:Actin-related protein 2 [Hordeum vulgare]|nr:Actin-related protein 2 [Hordeum vulgare]